MSVNLENTQTWQYFLQQLFNGPTGNKIDYSDFSSIDLDSLAENIGINKREFWLQLLNSLKNEDSFIPNPAAPSSGNVNFFRKQHLLPNYSYLLNYISSNIDLNYDEDINTWIRDNEKNRDMILQYSKFWNESVAELFKYVVHSFSPNAKNGIRLNPDIMNNIDENGVPIINIDGSHYYYIDDIKNVNAANSFKENEEWVKSWHNAKGETYKQVRGADIDLKAITNEQDLDFTADIESISANINLLMPEYNRNVLIEDLNRNFWVIGQSLTGISAFLFNENSPILTVFKGLIQELIELWENVLFLWLAFAISMQDEKKVTEVHEEIVYLYGSDFDEPYNNESFNESEMLELIKNDNKAGIANVIKQKINYLKEKYSNYHLVVVPILFLDNYEGDSYSSFYLYGVFTLNRNKDEDWQVTQFTDSQHPNLTAQKIYISKCKEHIMNYSDVLEQHYIFDEPIAGSYLIGKTYNNYNDQYLYAMPDQEFYYYSDKQLITYTYNNENYLNYRGIENSNITYYSIQHLLPMANTAGLSFSPAENINLEHTEQPILSYYDIESDTLLFNQFTLSIIDYGIKEYLTEKNITGSSWVYIINIFQENGEICVAPRTTTFDIDRDEWWQTVTDFTIWPLSEYESSAFSGMTEIRICHPKQNNSSINLNTKTSKNISVIFSFEEQI